MAKKVNNKNIKVKKKNKAFTLVELIAIVVILGLIAIIATPNIVKMVDNNKKEKFVVDARDMISKAKQKFGKDKYKDGIFEKIIGTSCYVTSAERLGMGKTIDPDGNSYNMDSSLVKVCEEKGEYIYYVKTNSFSSKPEKSSRGVFITNDDNSFDYVPESELTDDKALTYVNECNNLSNLDTLGLNIKYSHGSIVNGHATFRITVTDAIGISNYGIRKDYIEPEKVDSSPNTNGWWKKVEPSKKKIENPYVYDFDAPGPEILYFYAKNVNNNIKYLNIKLDYNDMDAPEVSAKVTDNKHVSVKVKDNIGVTGYAVMDKEEEPKKWISIVPTKHDEEKEIEFDKNIPGTYYVYAVDAKENVGHTSFTIYDKIDPTVTASVV